MRVGLTAESARLEVIDDGRGLDPSARDRVFDRFWRGGDGHRTSHDGSGLGLAIVSAVAQAHGGKASVTSHDDRLRGAHFVVELPTRPPT